MILKALNGTGIEQDNEENRAPWSRRPVVFHSVSKVNPAHYCVCLAGMRAGVRKVRYLFLYTRDKFFLIFLQLPFVILT